MWVDRFSDARRLLDGMVNHARELSAPGMLPLALAVRGDLEFWTGSWMSAFSDAWNAASLARESQQSAVLPYALVTMARVESASGREPDAREHLETAAELAGELGHRSIEYWAQATMGFLELGAGRNREAAGCLEPLVAAADDMGLWHPSALTWLGDLVEAQAALGGESGALKASSRLDELAVRTGGDWVTAAAHRARGLLDDGCERHFLEALGSSALVELPFERARTHLCLGGHLTRAERGAEAARHLWAARRDFARLSAKPWIERADRELAACGVSPGQVPEPTDLDRLTPQELQVATAVAAGATNRECAEQLFLSRRTVEHHLGNVYRKLGIHSRMHLVRLMSGAPH
jgi:DNA-binding CsgD family transcriptional regulator